MLPIYVLAAAAMLTASAAYAQDSGDPQQDETMKPGVRFAVPRSRAARPEPPPVAQPAAPSEASPRQAEPVRGDAPKPRPRARYGVPRSTPPPAAAPAPPPPAVAPEPNAPQGTPVVPVAPRFIRRSAGADQDRAVPRGSRPRGDNPPTGTAVPRGTPTPPQPPPTVVVPDRRSRDRVRSRGGVVVPPPAVYNNYYYYPRQSYPYGYGAFGLGYFYYDPYTWYPRSYSPYGGHYFPYSDRYFRSGFGFDVGELRLEVRPRDAQVFVDGAYAGVVDDYDGAFQALKLEPGTYHITIMAPGYRTLEFDVRIPPRQKINYRGELVRIR